MCSTKLECPLLGSGLLGRERRPLFGSEGRRFLREAGTSRRSKLLPDSRLDCFGGSWMQE